MAIAIWQHSPVVELGSGGRGNRVGDVIVVVDCLGGSDGPVVSAAAAVGLLVVHLPAPERGHLPLCASHQYLTSERKYIFAVMFHSNNNYEKYDKTLKKLPRRKFSCLWKSTDLVRGLLRRVVAAQHVLPQLVLCRPRWSAAPDPLFGPRVSVIVM